MYFNEVIHVSKADKYYGECTCTVFVYICVLDSFMLLLPNGMYGTLFRITSGSSDIKYMRNGCSCLCIAIFSCHCSSEHWKISCEFPSLFLPRNFIFQEVACMHGNLTFLHGCSTIANQYDFGIFCTILVPEIRLYDVLKYPGFWKLSCTHNAAIRSCVI